MLWVAIGCISAMNTIHSISLKTVQKDYIKHKADFILFNFFMNFIQLILLLLMPPYRLIVFSRLSFLYGISFGTLFLIAYLLLLKAMSMGPLSLSFLMFNINMLVPILFGLFFWGETLNITDLFGLALFIVSIYMISKSSYYEKDKKKKIDIKWLAAAISAFLISGAAISISKQFAIIRPEEAKEYLITYTFTIVFITGFISLYLRNGGRAPKFIPNKRYLGYSLLAGAPIAVANIVFMSFVALYESVIFFPGVKTANIAFILIFSGLIFKEKLSRKALAGLILSGVAIILVSV